MQINIYVSNELNEVTIILIFMPDILNKEQWNHICQNSLIQLELEI